MSLAGLLALMGRGASAPGVPSGALLDESGNPLLDESGNYLLEE